MEWIKSVEPAEEVGVFSNWRLKVNTGEASNFSFTTDSGRRVDFRSVPVLDQKDKVIGFVGNLKIIDQS